jgi:hypothetical protein
VTEGPEAAGFSIVDCIVFAGLYQLASGILDALKILKPETVIRWHRAGFGPIGAGNLDLSFPKIPSRLGFAL